MRKIELDSLRGAAALAVVLWHTTASSLHTFLLGSQFAPVDDFWAGLIMYSPLRIFSAGPEAVWLFFVLSGFVLTRSAASMSFRWDAYYPSRLLRLYLPIIGAVLVTAALFVALPRLVTPENSPFVHGLPTEYPVGWMVLDVTVLNGTSTANVPLWSLQWEVLFSVLLPLYVFMARSLPKVSILVSIMLIVASSWTGSLLLLYMPMFLVGSVLGFHWEAIARRLSSISQGGLRGSLLGALGVAVSIVLITASYTFNFVIADQVGAAATVTSNVVTLVKLIGICALLALALTFPPLRRLLRWRPLTALGAISFSLYLTHGPITTGLAFIMGPGIFTTCLQIAASLLVATGFYFAVERPAHGLARHVAGRIRERQTDIPATAELAPSHSSLGSPPSRS